MGRSSELPFSNRADQVERAKCDFRDDLLPEASMFIVYDHLQARCYFSEQEKLSNVSLCALWISPRNG